MRVRTNVCRQRFTHKPKGAKEEGYVQNNLTVPTDISTQDLADVLVHGGNMRIVACSGGAGDADFESGQLIGIDSDNKHNKQRAAKMIYPQDVRKRLEDHGIKTNFQYETWSSTPDWIRFRTVIALDKPVYDAAMYLAIMYYIFSLFDGTESDRGAETLSRVFYGSGAQHVLYADYDACNSAEELYKRCPEYIKAQAREKAADIDSRKQQGKKSRKSKAGKNHHSRSKSREADAVTIDCIKHHKWRVLRSHLGYETKTVFQTRQEFFDYLYRIPLDEVFGVDAGKSFHCILPGHDDNTPSASVFVNDRGTWQYRCFAEKLTVNIKQLFEAIGQFKNEYECLEFVKQVFNLQVRETEWSKAQRANIDLILRCLSSTDSDGFSVLCPQASRNTVHATAVYIAMLLIARDLIQADREGGSEQIVFFCSVGQLAKVTGKQQSKVQAYLKQLLYHRMVEICPKEEIPARMLNTSIVRAGKASVEHKPRKRVEYYRIPSWVFERVRLIEDRGIKWKVNGYRLKHLTYEEFYRTEGAEIAKELYPQHAVIHLRDGEVKRTTSKQADKRHEEIANFVLATIERQGYCTEKMILADQNLKDLCGGKHLTEGQVQRSLADIMNAYGLRKIRANKGLKQKYGISGGGYPNIIIMQ